MSEEIKKNEVQSSFIGGDLPFQEESEKKPVNLRVQKFLLLSAKVFGYTPKGQKAEKSAASLLFLDANDCDYKTGQPLVVGKTPVVSAFVIDPNPSICALSDYKVFTPVFIKMSGNDGFIRVHEVLSNDQIAAYRQIMGDI